MRGYSSATPWPPAAGSHATRLYYGGAGERGKEEARAS